MASIFCKNFQRQHIIAISSMVDLNSCRQNHFDRRRAVWESMVTFHGVGQVIIKQQFRQSVAFGPPGRWMRESALSHCSGFQNVRIPKHSAFTLWYRTDASPNSPWLNASS